MKPLAKEHQEQQPRVNSAYVRKLLFPGWLWLLSRDTASTLPLSLQWVVVTPRNSNTNNAGVPWLMWCRVCLEHAMSHMLWIAARLLWVLSAQCRSVLDCIVGRVVELTLVHVFNLTQAVILGTHTCNPRTWETDAGALPWVQSFVSKTLTFYTTVVKIVEAGERHQWLRALAALAEDPGRGLSIHTVTWSSVTPVPMPVPVGLMPSSDLTVTHPLKKNKSF